MIEVLALATDGLLVHVGTPWISSEGVSMMTVREIAKTLRISLACAYSLVESGQLPCYRIGTGRGTIRISQEQLERYLKRSLCGRLPEGRPSSDRRENSSDG